MVSIYKGRAFCKLRERDKSKQATEQRRKKRRKKGEELEGKSQVLLEGGLSAATVWCR